MKEILLATMLMLAGAQSEHCKQVFIQEGSKLVSPCQIDAETFNIVLGYSNKNFNQLYNRALSKLESICTTECEQALALVAQTISSDSECRDEKLVANGLSIQDSVGYALGLRGAACVKTVAGNYCIKEQEQLFTPIAEKISSSDASDFETAFNIIKENKEAVCTDCFHNQLKAISNVNQVPDSIQVLTKAPEVVLAPVCLGKIATVNSAKSEGQQYLALISLIFMLF